jgi:hypothetical protein
MAVPEWLREYLQSISPTLLALGMGIVAVETALSLGVVVLVELLPGLPGSAVAGLLAVALVTVTAPLFVALYAPYRAGRTAPEATLQAAWDALRSSYVPVLQATMVSVAVAVAVAVLSTMAYTVAATALRAGMYLLGDPSAPGAVRFVLELQAVFFLSLFATMLCTRFADLAVMVEDVSPRTAWRRSLRVVRQRPRAFLGYALGVVVFFGTPMLMGVAGNGGDGGTEVVAVLAGNVIVGGVATTFLAAFHSRYFDWVGPTGLAHSRFVAVPWRRLGLVALVLIVAVSGAAAVRTADLGVGPATQEPLPAAPNGAFETAVENTVERNHRRTVWQRNESANQQAFQRVESSVVEYDDRQFAVAIHGDEMAIGGYYDEGTLATMHEGDPNASLRQLLATESFETLPVPGYGVIAGDDPSEVLDPSLNWTRTDSSGRYSTYRIPQAELAAGLPTRHAGGREPFGPDSYLRAVVDTERGVVDHVRYRIHSQETGYTHTYEVRYTVSDVDIQRPPDIQPRSPLVWVWDALYY